MKNILLVLALVLGLAVLGFVLRASPALQQESAPASSAATGSEARADSSAQESTRRWLVSEGSTLPFSQAVVAGDTVYVAGTLGIDPETGRVPEAVADEVRIAMDEIARRLAELDLTMADVVSVQVYCTDLALYDEFNEVYSSYFEAGRYPARAFLGSGPLLRGARFEIVATAHR